MTNLRGKIQAEPSIKVTVQSGVRGKSAYEVWLDEGNEGTVDEFLQDMRGDKINTYVHTQIQASTDWEIHHNLDKYPSTTIVDTGGNVVIGDVKYIDRNTVHIIFISEFSGKVYFN